MMRFLDSRRQEARGRRLEKRPGQYLFPVIFLAACLLPLAAQAAPNGDELLRQMTAAEEKIEYSGIRVIQRPGKAREVARIFRDGHKRRLEWLEPAVKKGDVLVDDAQSVWLFHRAENAAIETKTPAHTHNPPTGAQKVEATRAAGRAAWIVTLASGRKVTIDAANKARLKSEDGLSMALQSVQFGSVPAAKFSFSPPPGAQVTRSRGTLYVSLAPARAAASWLRAPSQLPAGYELESAIVDPAGEVWLRYSNGARRFSLFQQKASGDDVAPQKVEGGWFWKSGGLRFLVTGAPDGAIPSLASSLQ